MSGRLGGHSTRTVMPRCSASGADIDTTSLMIVDSCTGWSRSSSGRANFRNPTTTRSSRRISSAITFTCLVRSRLRVPPAGVGHGDRLGHRRELLLEQLEVDGHRVERVLDLVRDAGHQPSERGELARVVQRRVHVAEEAEVARDEHHAEKAAARCPRSHGTSAAARPAPARTRRARPAQSTPVPASAGRPARARRAAAPGCRPAAGVTAGSGRSGAGDQRRQQRRASRSWRTSARLPARTAPSRLRGCPSRTRSRSPRPAAPGCAPRTAGR